MSITGQESETVVVRSWSQRETKVKEKIAGIHAVTEGREYELDADSTPGQDKQFRLRLRQDNLKTLRTANLPCWIVDFREITKHDSGVRTIGPNLLSVEGPGFGHNFPREEWAGFFCPIDVPKKVLDGELYPIRAERKFLIDGFVLKIHVTQYLFNKDQKRFSMDLQIALSNQ